MKPEHFRDAEPRLELERYFLGDLRAWGIFEDRFGDLRRQFLVDITGSRSGDELVLDERFRYADGATDRRIWRIRRTGEHTYEGRADDVVGCATGVAYGNALNWQYDFDLPVAGRKIRVHFNDWLFLQPDGVLINRARITKFRIALGEVTLFFKQAGGAGPLSGQAAQTGARPAVAGPVRAPSPVS